MKRIVVTGANKGIGRAIVEAIVAEHDDAFVYLGSRDRARGEETRAAIAQKDRVEVLPIDVADERSIAAAAKQLEGKGPLYGLVNNAGIATDLRSTVLVNVIGVERTCAAFVPLLDPKGGRVVNVTSAAGPSYVATLKDEEKRFLLDKALTWPKLKAFLEERIAKNDVSEAYGFSKACANAYTEILAREHPELHVNACTPGFIQTDLNRRMWEGNEKTAAERGMKTPAEGARSSVHLLFAELEGNGRYYGSDSKRSPLDRYRAPGSPAFTD